MEPQRQIAPATVDYVYEIAARGRASEIDRALSQFPVALRLRDPAAIALRAMKHVLGGDVPAAIALLQRAVAAAPHPDRAYLTDLLVPLLYSSGDLSAAEAVLDAEDDVPTDLMPLFLAARAFVAASRGDDDKSRWYAKRALPAGRALDSPTIVARVLQRVAVAAFYCADYDEAQDRAIEAARAFAAVEAYRHAAANYSILYAMAYGAGDADLARFYAEKIAVSGKLAGDLSVQNMGIVAQLATAAQCGDEKRLGSMRARLLANQLNQQYRERFAFIHADVLMHGWAGRFDAARGALQSVLKSDQRSTSERAACEALLALCAVATWNLEEARHYAHQAIHHSADAAGTEAPYDRGLRQAARVLAAAACLISGEPSVGRRALTKAFDSDGRYARVLSETGMAEEDVPPLMRGYARFVNAAYDASLRSRPKAGLTTAEVDVLRSLVGGATLDAVATALGKSRKTVERQITSIYAKLDVSNRSQAIQRARELGVAR